MATQGTEISSRQIRADGIIFTRNDLYADSRAIPHDAKLKLQSAFKAPQKASNFQKSGKLAAGKGNP